MAANARDTIFALSSGAGRAGVAVIRVSGPRTGAAIEALTGHALPKPRRAVLRKLKDQGGAALDEALVLWFASPHSYTGEDCGEFHIHGGRAVCAGVFDALAKLGLRPAEPGEFTRRAVENGRLDLTRAEAIADLVDAETSAQRDLALRQYDGALAVLYEGWRSRLIRSAAWAEAAIDFEDQDLPENALADARRSTGEILKEIQVHLNDSRRGELLRDGIYLTVIGPPNAGKSTLVNTLARRDVAIVSETAGTTRDVIEVHLDIGGYPVIVADTAGLRETQDAVEAEGVRRALARAARADITLLLLDGSAQDPFENVSRETLDAATLVVWNKADLGARSMGKGLSLSLKTGAGLDQLIEQIGQKVRDRVAGPREAVPLTRARHRQALEEAAQALDRAKSAKVPELFAEDLRLAMRAIGRITGRVDIEDLLDVVFRDFCIGK